MVSLAPTLELPSETGFYLKCWLSTLGNLQKYITLVDLIDSRPSYIVSWLYIPHGNLGRNSLDHCAVEYLSETFTVANTRNGS